MGKEFSKELVAPCGMDCNVCSGYLAFRHDMKNKGIRMSTCEGCRPRDKQCAFLKKRCVSLKNHTVSFCYECNEYPCENLLHIDMRYKKYFRMSLLENLSMIQKNGIEKFLEVEAEKWCCQTCEGVLCCHNGLCFHCDTDLLREKKQKYRWDDE